MAIDHCCHMQVGEASTLQWKRDGKILCICGDESQLVGLVSRREVLQAFDKYYDELNRGYSSEHIHPDLHQVMNLRFVAGKG